MSWSQLHGGAQCHPKVVALEGLLGISELEARGIALGLWGWTIQWEPSGDLSKQTPATIARGLAWRGDPVVLIDALVAARLLDRDGDRLLLHDWMDYAKGWTEAVRLRKHRDKEAKKKSRTRTVRVRYENGTRTVVSPSPSLLRSEEESVRGEPPEPAVITVPCAGGRAFPVTAAQVARWGELFPAVDVMAVIRAAVAWSEANPRKRKTAGRCASWLASTWLAREQNESGARDRSQRVGVPVPQPRPPRGVDFTGTGHEMPGPRPQGSLKLAPKVDSYRAHAAPETATLDLFGGEHEEAQA